MAPNLVLNGTLATGSPIPDGFYLSGWGDLVKDTALEADVPAWAPPGSRSFRITISARTSGDYKLMQQELPGVAPSVVGGEFYNASVDYKATVPVNLTAFKHTAAGWSYWTELGTLPATAAWASATVSLPPIPADVDQIEYGVSISTDGTLFTTNYALRLTFEDVELSVGEPVGFPLTAEAPTGHPLTVLGGDNVRLASTGREYAHFTVDVAADTALEVSFDGGATWAAMTRPSDTEARVLVAGPEALTNPAGTVVLTTGHNPALVRLTSNPEVVIRTAGTIYVYTL